MADEPVEEPQAPPETPPGPAPGPPAPEDTPGDDLAALRRENAARRRQLRDAEQERDQLRTRVDALERADVERLAAGLGMATPADVWLLVQNLDDLRVDGALSADRVQERVQTILTERPSWKRSVSPDTYGGGSRLGNGVPRDLGLYDLLRQKQHPMSRRG
jgi:hypothetical protein